MSTRFSITETATSFESSAPELFRLVHKLLCSDLWVVYLKESQKAAKAGQKWGREDHEIAGQLQVDEAGNLEEESNGQDNNVHGGAEEDEEAIEDLQDQKQEQDRALLTIVGLPSKLLTYAGFTEV